MSSSTPIRFLLDENVRIELDAFLAGKSVDFIRAKKGSSDAALAKLSLRERRIVVTNDTDFAYLRRSQVFGVVLLRVPQGNVHALLETFASLLAQEKSYRGVCIVLESLRRSIVTLESKR